MSAAATGRDEKAPPASIVSPAQALRVWAKIGVLGFGGPAGQIALMHRELVEQRRWISESRFLHALNYCMLLPGPEAQQLAVYIGWLMHRTWGGVAAGFLFVFPGALVLAVLIWLYVSFGTTPVVAALFFGLKAAVLATVVEAVLRIGRRALKTRFAVAMAVAAFVAIYAFHIAFPWIVFGAAAIGLCVHRWGPLAFEVPVWNSLEPGAALLATAAMVAMLRFKLGLGWTLLASGSLAPMAGKLQNRSLAVAV